MLCRYAETFAGLLDASLNRTKELGAMLSKAKLNEKFSDTSLSDQLLQVHPGPHPRPQAHHTYPGTRAPCPGGACS